MERVRASVIPHGPVCTLSQWAIANIDAIHGAQGAFDGASGLRTSAMGWKAGVWIERRLIPSLTDDHPCAQRRSPIDMMRHG